MVFFHGLGLDFLASLYLDLARSLAAGADVFLVGLRASGFVHHNRGFRKPGGWAYQRQADSIADARAWLEWVASRRYRTVILGGHSWGALLALAADPDRVGARPALLLSPLPSTWDIVQANYNLGPEDAGTLLERLRGTPDADLVPTQPGSPVPFLSAGTLRDLITVPLDLSPLLRARVGRTLLTTGQLEHERLRARIETIVSDNQGVTLIQVPKEGHFYTTGVHKLAPHIRAWLETL